MPRIAYITKNFKAETLDIIRTANEIINDYQQEGYDLTLRQLYYQFVSRALMPNTDKSYNRLGSIINDARLAGMVDWDAIVDRTRNLQSNAHWNDPSDMVSSCANQFVVDKWDNQKWRPEVWIEKDALVGVIEGACDELDVPYFSCRGYTSQSEMWSAARRLKRYGLADQTPFIIHLGDHDPSGIDMTRDIFDRMTMFMGGLEVRRIALNMNQIEELGPPPNPAKVTDSRAEAYMDKFGDESWELDALEPSYIDRIIREAIDEVRDPELWAEQEEREADGRAKLKFVADDWDDITEGV